MNRDWWQVPKDDFAVHHDLRVRYNEIDGQGIVFNGNYLIYADIGVTELFRALGGGQPGPFFAQYGSDIVMVNAELDYHASFILEDVMTVSARVARISRSSFTIHIALFRGIQRMTDMALTYAHVEMDRSMAIPLPGSFIADVRSFQPRPPEQIRPKAS
ncbi:MAG: thioesterase family protein [Sphingopyxis sp.]